MPAFIEDYRHMENLNDPKVQKRGAMRTQADRAACKPRTGKMIGGKRTRQGAAGMRENRLAD
jgi:hypothetical protein